MSKRVKVAAVGAAAVVAVGAGLGVRAATADSACQVPRTLLGSEQTDSIRALEAYITENIAPTFKQPQYMQWQSNDYSPILLPNKISATIVVVAGVEAPRYYHITVVRECQGDDWKVVEFKRVKG